MLPRAEGARLAEYGIFETNQFQKDLAVIARSGQADILDKLRTTVYPQLRARPHFGPNIRKLKNFAPETWRYRVGAWRFFYGIDETRKRVSMVAAAHRGSAY